MNPADLLPLVYDELRKLAAAKLAHEQPGHTLDATALVHEAYLRLVGNQHFEHRDWVAGWLGGWVAGAMATGWLGQRRPRRAPAG